MHGRDPRTDNRPTREIRIGAFAGHGKQGTEPGHGNRHQQGSSRQHGIVAMRKVRGKSEHRNEMRSPYAAAEGNSHNPGPELFMNGATRVTKQIGRCIGCKNADSCCKKNKAEIMLVDDTIVYSQHSSPP